VLQTWEMELPPGDYFVGITVGDSDHSQGPHFVMVEGTPLFGTEITSPGEHLTMFVVVTVRDARLTVDCGGADEGTTTINSLEVTPVGRIAAVNFQPLGVPVPEGFVPDTGSQYDVTRGYGWNGSFARFTKNREIVSNRALDTLIVSRETVRTWNFDVENGDYQVTIASGDPAYPQGPQRVVVEGQVVLDGEISPASMFMQRTLCVNVEDGNISVEIGGLPTVTLLNFAVISSCESAPGSSVDDYLLIPELLESPTWVPAENDLAEDERPHDGSP
jgi:hypothetical protein